MAQRNYTPKGTWLPADNTGNRLEVCEVTEDENIVGLRSTYTPEAVLFVPRQQLINFATALQSGQMARIGLHG